MESKVTVRYARSLMQLAIEHNLEDKIFDDVSLIAKTCTENRQLSLLLRNPVINTDKKDAILEAIFKGKITDITLQFMQVITRKKREFYIEDITREYINMYKKLKRISSAKIITAAPLEENLREEILLFLKEKTGNTIELEEVVDKNIIGGYILRWGDEQIDASVHKKLQKLRQDFKPNLYVKDY